MECLLLSSIRHIIGIQWNLKNEDVSSYSKLENCDNSLDAPKTSVCSPLCRIKGMEDSVFILELTGQVDMHAKGSYGWSYQIISAFAIIKDRAFMVKENEKLKFLDILTIDLVESAEEIAFHCVLLIKPPKSSSMAMKAEPVDNVEGIPTKGRVCIDLDRVGHHCKFDGEIPKFTVDKAKELITNESTDSVLKVLAMEYLMKNITDDNVSDILNVAIRQDLKVIQKQCSDFLSSCTIRYNSPSTATGVYSDSDESVDSNDRYQNLVEYLNDIAPGISVKQYRR